jgi:hypothetical protein
VEIGSENGIEEATLQAGESGFNKMGTEDGKSVVHTTIQAVGTNPEGVSNTRVPCSSTHQLEYRIAQEVAELAKG